MAIHLQIKLTRSPVECLHRFRNFGEDVFREMREECSLSINEIDQANGVFYVRDLRARFLRTAAAKIRRIALKHRLADRIDVTEVTG